MMYERATMNYGRSSPYVCGTISAPNWMIWALVDPNLFSLVKPYVCVNMLGFAEIFLDIYFLFSVSGRA